MTSRLAFRASFLAPNHHPDLDGRRWTNCGTITLAGITVARVEREAVWPVPSAVEF